MSFAANYGNPVGSKSVRDVTTFREVVAIGASGAASQDATTAKSTGYDNNKFTATNDGSNAGVYLLTFPKGKRAWIGVELYSPSLTVVGWAITAKDAQAGTATLKTLAGTNAAAATEPASGDKLFITITVER